MKKSATPFPLYTITAEESKRGAAQRRFNLSNAEYNTRRAARATRLISIMAVGLLTLPLIHVQMTV